MDEIEGSSKRTRAPGIHYPGASIAKVLELLKVLDAAGGTSSIGRVSAKLGMPEGAASFKRVLISARNYGFAEWENTDKSVIAMTEGGHKALAGDLAVLKRALVLPSAFRTVARKFSGRTLPTEGLAEAFKVAGVAPAGAQLAADNFEASAVAAGVLSDEKGRKVLAHDLPFDEVDAESASEGASDRAVVPARTALAGAKRVALKAAPRTSAPMAPGSRAMPVRAPSPLNVGLRIDVSGWSVEQVVDLARRLREEGLG